jgi:molybdopterin-guanine dinucleotide biosynthesis protein A
VTGIILAGGRSSRMGADKAWLDWKGRPLIACVAEALRAAGCAEVLAVGGDDVRVAACGMVPVADSRPGEGPLPALRDGLAAARSPLALAVACDMPHLRPAALGLLARLAAGCDAAVPWIPPGGWEPLHAAYATSCLPALEARLARGERKMTCFYEDVRVRAVTREDLLAVDPALASLRNVNTPEELAAARVQ